MTNPRTARLMAAGAIGNLLEWYDFAVYGYFAAAIGRIMKPTANTPKAASTWATLSCSGKKARPIAAAK